MYVQAPTDYETVNKWEIIYSSENYKICQHCCNFEHTCVCNIAYPPLYTSVAKQQVTVQKMLIAKQEWKMHNH